MGMLDLINTAKQNLKEYSDAEFLTRDQTGTILIHALTLFESRFGRWAALNGEIVEAAPKVTGAIPQRPGTRVKVMFQLHGKRVDVQLTELAKLVKAVYDVSTDEAFAAALKRCLGSSGVTTDATESDRADPMFGARGVLVGFSTSVKTEPFVNVKFSHVNQEPEEILSRAAKLPEVK